MWTVSCRCWSAHALRLESCQSQMVHLWRFFPPHPVVFMLARTKHLDSTRFIPSLFLPVVSNIHLRVLSDNPGNIGVVWQFSPIAKLSTCRRHVLPGVFVHLLNLLFCVPPPPTFTGSNSGYQADPSQLPEDMVHPGRDSSVPHRIHTVVCGNNEHCCCCCTLLCCSQSVIKELCGLQTVTTKKRFKSGKLRPSCGWLKNDLVFFILQF